MRYTHRWRPHRFTRPRSKRVSIPLAWIPLAMLLPILAAACIDADASEECTSSRDEMPACVIVLEEIAGDTMTAPVRKLRRELNGPDGLTSTGMRSPMTRTPGTQWMSTPGNDCAAAP